MPGTDVIEPVYVAQISEDDLRALHGATPGREVETWVVSLREAAAAAGVQHARVLHNAGAKCWLYEGWTDRFMLPHQQGEPRWQVEAE